MALRFFLAPAVAKVYHVSMGKRALCILCGRSFMRQRADYVRCKACQSHWDAGMASRGWNRRLGVGDLRSGWKQILEWAKKGEMREHERDIREFVAGCRKTLDFERLDSVARIYASSALARLDRGILAGALSYH